MAETSAIGWTDATWPIVQGCDAEDPGCANCYAVFDIWRQMHSPNAKVSGPIAGVVRKDARGVLSWTGEVACREDRLDWPLGWKKPKRIFVPSLGDLFHEAVPDEFIDRVFAVMALTPQHTYQVLTRRTARAREYLSRDETPLMRIHAAAAADIEGKWQWIRDRAPKGSAITQYNLYLQVRWPLRNVWLGASVPNQEWANKRLPDLLATPAALHFVSYEPALGPIDFTQIELDPLPSSGRRRKLNALDGWISVEEEAGSGHWRHGPSTAALGWGIIGGESIRRKAKDARPFDLYAAKAIIDQFAAHGVPLFVKQLGHNPVWRAENGRTISYRPNITGKGTDPAEWPPELRVQQFPEAP